MSEVIGRAYYNTRAVRALELAKKAINPEIADIHNRMAKSYFELAEMSPDDSRQSHLSQEGTGRVE